MTTHNNGSVQGQLVPRKRDPLTPERMAIEMPLAFCAQKDPRPQKRCIVELESQTVQWHFLDHHSMAARQTYIYETINVSHVLNAFCRMTKGANTAPKNTRLCGKNRTTSSTTDRSVVHAIYYYYYYYWKVCAGLDLRSSEMNFSWLPFLVLTSICHSQSLITAQAYWTMAQGPPIFMGPLKEKSWVAIGWKMSSFVNYYFAIIRNNNNFSL